MEQHKTHKLPVDFNLWEWVKAVCAVILTAVVAFKIYSMEITTTIDFSALLSLLLALFAVGLSALFYFKATDTSNAFYDNTYKFTKDIAELLVKIESGFGEKLRHLDEGYSSMRNYLQNTTPRVQDVEKTKEKLETERQEIEKVRAERDDIVKQLIERSQLEKVEKDRITMELLEKEKELAHSQAEIAKLNKRLTVDRLLRPTHRKEIPTVDEPFIKFTYERVVKVLGADRVRAAHPENLIAEFDDLELSLPRGYLKDLAAFGFYDSCLTIDGVRFLKDTAVRFDGSTM